MQYLIKLEDRGNGREVFVECPANMSFEDFSVKIKVYLDLPLTDYGNHCFMKGGKVYVPANYIIYELWGREEENFLPFDVQEWINYPRGKAIRSSERYRLNQVFTVLYSVIVYNQNSAEGWDNVRCTLIERIP